MVPTKNTKKFIRYVSSLLESGVVEKQYMIAEEIELNKTLLSSIMNGSKQVPSRAFKKFVEVYQPKEINDPDRISLENSIRTEVVQEVILSALAELLAHQRGQTVKTITDSMLKSVNDLLKERLNKL